MMPRSLLVLAALLAIPEVAGAATLIAPMVYASGSEYISCLATNSGTKPTRVTVTGRDMAGATVAAQFDVCTVDVPPGGTCAASFGASVSCTFTSKGKLRAAVVLLDGLGHQLGSTPATK